MATIKPYLDTRRQKKDGSFPLRVSVQYRGRTIYYNTGLSFRLDQWRNAKVTNHPQKVLLNNHISGIISRVSAIMLLIDVRANNLTPADVLQRIKDELRPQDKKQNENTFYKFAEDFARAKTGRTRELYETTISKLKEYAETINVEDVTPDFLDKYEAHLKTKGNAVNTIAIDFRNIRAIYNDIIKHDEKYLLSYPFRRFQIKREQTPFKTLTLEQLGKLYFIGTERPEYRRAVDVFLLSFYLIGINPVDIARLKREDLRDGVVYYQRAKTGKYYEIALQEPARELLKRYAGKDYLLRFMDEYKEYRNFNRRQNLDLHKVGELIGVPCLTMYYARYTWANIAHRLKISKDVISLSLGHSFGVRVTDVYINYDADQVNEANEIVINNFRIFLLIMYAHNLLSRLYALFPYFSI